MFSQKPCGLHKVAMNLVWLGALNWGLVGAFNLDLVDLIFGGAPIIQRIIYVLIGLSALGVMTSCKCKSCKGV